MREIRKTWARLAAVLVLCASASGVATAAELRSPWDKTPAKVTSAEYACPSVPTLPHDVVANSYYSDSKKSVVDPVKKAAYESADADFRQVQDRTAKAADAFQKTGSRAAAACVLTLLTQQAAADAMTGSMSSNQAYYMQNWTLGALAISALKVRSAHAGTPEQQQATDAWMRKVAGEVKAYFQARHEKGTDDGRNNHLYWAGFAVMAAGIATDDHGLYDWGVSTYKYGVSLVTADGTLPLEMNRGARALHYHLFALAPLVTMAELGEANGDNLYAFDHNKLHLLVTRSLSGVIDNKFFAEKAGVRQDTPAENGRLKADDIEWVRPYARRFPDPLISRLQDKAGLAPFGYIGGLPPE